MDLGLKGCECRAYRLNVRGLQGLGSGAEA